MQAGASSRSLHRAVWLVAMLVLLCALSILTPVSAASGGWVKTAYSSCSVRRFKEAYASLQKDDSTPTNYMGSTSWIENDERAKEVHVKGQGHACFVNGDSGAALLSFSDCPSTKEPLELFECRDTTTSVLSYVYLAIGVPLIIWALLYMHLKHRQLMEHNDCPKLMHSTWGQWTILFTQTGALEAKVPGFQKALDDELAFQSDSNWHAHLRFLMVEHSFFCFFFISSLDAFNWRSRLFCFVLEQGINFSANALFSTVLPDSGSMESAAVIILASVGACLGVSVILPVRRLVRSLQRQRAAGCGALFTKLFARIWLGVSVLTILGLVLFVLIRTGISGGKGFGAAAPDQGPGLLFFSFKSFCAAVPYHLLVEVLTCALTLKILWKGSIEDMNEYTIKFCVPHDKNPLRWSKGRRDKILAQQQEAAYQQQLQLGQQQQQQVVFGSGPQNGLAWSAPPPSVGGSTMPSSPPPPVHVFGGGGMQQSASPTVFGSPTHGQRINLNPAAVHPAPAYATAAYATPAYSQPAYVQPAYAQPAYAQPAYGQPAYGQPAYGQVRY